MNRLGSGNKLNLLAMKYGYMIYIHVNRSYQDKLEEIYNQSDKTYHR